MKDILKQFTPQELYAAAIEAAMAQISARPLSLGDAAGWLSRLERRPCERTEVIPPKTAAATPDTIERSLVLHVIWDLGARRGDPGWRDFCVEAYRAFSAGSMKSFEELKKDIEDR